LGEASARLTKQYGGLIRYHGLFNQPHLLIADPELVQKIMINRSYDYPKYFIDKRIAREFLGGDGILLAEGDSHKRQRKMMNPSFAFANVKEMVPTFVQAGHKLKDIWMKQIGNNKEERITITTVIPKITLDVIGLVAHAYKALVGRNTSFLFRTVESFFPFIRKLPIPYYTDFYDSIKTIKKVSEKLISEQKNSTIQGKDLLSLLVQSNEKLPVDEQLTHNELISQVMILLLAGHETTSTALSWALYFLAKNPDVQDRLRKEVVELFTDRDHFPTFDEIEQLKYLECVFKETLRIVPPEYFNPSRWLDPEIKSKITNSNFIPFSAGPKNCLGMKMAHLELKSILSVIIRNFEFKLVEGFTFKKKLIGIAKPIPGVDLLVSKIDY
ncbi:5710_t:CDS:2, partial [Gigaspora margarita]